ncbi:MAG TPA: anti-sigma factor, partial [Longimicrobiales bacterium]|nr:anti-sigma factor [Longimicrobiales bacterium]
MPGSLALAVVLVVGCGGDSTGPAPGAPLTLQLHGLRALDAGTEGTYEGWLVDGGGRATSAGRFDLPASGRVTLEAPAAPASAFLLTVEPPGDEDGVPSDLKLLTGPFRGGEAVLGVTGAVTSGVPLEPEPGTHVLFTPSDNAELGYPSHEDAGIWLFNIKGDTLDGSF